MKIKTTKPKINKEKLKPKRGKAYDCTRNISNLCPYCNSRLAVKEGKYCCNTANCEFSSTITNPISKDSVTIPDPFVVNTIERSLGRQLQVHELDEEFTFFTDGESYTVSRSSESEPFKIPRIRFPEDL